MSLKDRSIRAVMWAGLQSWGGQLIGLVVFGVLARLLDPADWGLLAMATVYLAFVRVFVDQGLTLALVQRDELEQAHNNTAFYINLIVSSLLMLVTIAIAKPVAALFGESELTPLLIALSITLPINSLGSVQIALLQRELNFKPLALRTLLATVISGIIGIALAFMGYGVWALVISQIASAVIQTVILWFASNWRPTLDVSRKHFDDLFSYAANVLGINLLEYVNRQADNFLIGIYLGPVALGYYNVAYRLFHILTMLLSGITSSVTFASFSTLQNDIPRLRSAFYNVTRMVSVISFPVFAGLCVLAPEILAMVFGEKWSISGPVLQVLALVGILESVYFFNANVMMAMGKPSWRLKLNLCSAVVNVIGFFIAVRYGIVAVAAAYVIRAYLLSPLPLIAVKRLINISYRSYLNNLAAVFISSVTMAITIVMFTDALASGWPALFTLLLGMVVGISSYLMSLYWLDRNLLIGFLKTARIIRS